MKYKIALNQKTYEVEVEKGKARILGTTASPYVPETPTPSPLPSPAPVNTAGAAQPAGEALLAPMPGAIIDIRVSAGDSVKSGQVLLILEAMKMENEIVCPHDATVTKVAVVKGASVASGDPLVWLA